MKRKIDAELDAWKTKEYRKPLLLLGARQTGKTTSLLAFGRRMFADTVHVDFIEQPSLRAAFEGNLNPEHIITNLSAFLRCNIETENTLLILDEIQECEAAISSLKYFATKMPQMAVCAAGSLLGVYISRNQGSFPVGYVDMHTLHPMDFEEFCWASGEQRAFSLVQECFSMRTSCALHESMLQCYQNYLLCGGMPKAVVTWMQDRSLFRVQEIQRTIIMGYIADMSKHAANVDAGKIFACWDSIPSQLAKENTSTKFLWKSVAGGAKAVTHRSALDWLESAGIIDVVTQIECMEAPLKSFENAGSFKAYVADTGLLACAYNACPDDLSGKGARTARFRGGMAENYVAQQLKAAEVPHYYWGMQSKAEVEFVIKGREGVLPIDVKSGVNTGAKSLMNAAKKYDCPYAIIVSAKNFGFENGIFNIPLYAAGLLAHL